MCMVFIFLMVFLKPGMIEAETLGTMESEASPSSASFMEPADVEEFSTKPDPPSAESGVESIEVTDYVSGADLKLYRTDGLLIDTKEGASGSSYIFTDVVPHQLGYYVTQTVNSLESDNCSFLNSILRTPTGSAGVGYADVSNIYPGAQVYLYDSDGSEITNDPSDQGNGILRFAGLTAGESYYAIQEINGVVSQPTALIRILADPSEAISAPTATAGVESIVVANYEDGATLKLYRTDGVLMDTKEEASGISYTFTGVEPHYLGYYVTQTVGTKESTNCDFLNSILRTPVISAGVSYVDVSNVYPGAQVHLYEADGSEVMNDPSDQGNGILRFAGLTAGKSYYAVQKINNVNSQTTELATIPTDPLEELPAPEVTAGVESVTVTGYESGADLKLYLTNGILIKEGNGVTSTSYTFTNVEPDPMGYYVTQTKGTKESVNSQFVNSILRTPVIAGGLGYIEVSNVYPGARLCLYDLSGALVSDSPADQGGGIWRFTNLTPGEWYFADQKFNDVVSPASGSVMVLSDSADAPVVSGSVEAIVVTGYENGATLNLYLTNGTLIKTVTGVTGTSYIFKQVEPDRMAYYVTQKIGTKESVNSTFVNSILRTPAAVGDIGSVKVTNVYPGARICLYDISGTLVSDYPADQGGSIWKFSGLTPGKFYYAVQENNGVISPASGIVKVLGKSSDRDDDDDDDDDDSDSTSSSSASNVQYRTVEVKPGNADKVVSQITIERLTDSNGIKRDQVTFRQDKALETVRKLKEEGGDIARIIIPGNTDEVSETLISLPYDATKVLTDSSVGLQIESKDIKMGISGEFFKQAAQGFIQDIYFRLIPVRETEKKETVVNRTVLEVGNLYKSGENNISVLGTPVTIETNMPSSEMDITLPLTGIQLPSASEEREEFLKQLAVYIEHSDGEKELVQGEITEYGEGVFGIRFHIKKFSTFTIVRVTKDHQYDTNIKLGLIGSKSYAEKVAAIFKRDYDCANIAVIKEKKYYRVTIDFPDRQAAVEACQDMIARKYIVNYYFYTK